MMNTHQDRRSAMACFLRNVLLIDLGMMVISLLVCWFMGWRSLYAYGHGLIDAGFVAAALGMLGTSGLTQTAGDPRRRYSLAFMSNRLYEVSDQHAAQMQNSLGFLARMTVAGAVAAVVGLTIQIVVPPVTR